MTATARPAIALRPMLPGEGSRLASLFAASIEGLTGDDYSPEQQSAWIGMADHAATFNRRLESWLTLVAVVDGEPVGFAAFEAPSQIAMLYVDPVLARQGVATSLLAAIEKLAKARGARTLAVEASDTAQAFFTRRGYTAKHRSTVTIGGEWLGRTGMDKTLGGETAAKKL